MNIVVTLIVALVTIVILSNVKINKTSSQLMLLGIEITVIGMAFLLFCILYNSNDMTVYFIIGEALIVAGVIVNIFGFNKE